MKTEIIINGIYEHVDTEGSRYRVMYFGSMKVGKSWVDAVIYRKEDNVKDVFIREKSNSITRFKLINQ
jgi:hypothetical protein